MQQHDLFATEAPEPKAYVPNLPDPAVVRAKQTAVLETARAATAMPWTDAQMRYHVTVFPQMSRWLPDEERAALCAQFDAEMARLRAAA